MIQHTSTDWDVDIDGAAGAGGGNHPPTATGHKHSKVTKPRLVSRPGSSHQHQQRCLVYFCARMSGKCTGLGERVVPRLRESRHLTPSGKGGRAEFTQPRARSMDVAIDFRTFIPYLFSSETPCCPWYWQIRSTFEFDPTAKMLPFGLNSAHRMACTSSREHMGRKRGGPGCTAPALFDLVEGGAWRGSGLCCC